MKTLLLSEIFPPRTGGSGRWFWEIYHRMPTDRFVIAAGMENGYQEFDSSHDLNIHRMPLTFADWGITTREGIQNYWQSYKTICEIVRREQIERIHCGRLLPEGLIGWLVSKRFHIPYVCYVHGEDANAAGHDRSDGVLSSRQLRFLTRLAIAGSDHIIANSQNSARIVRKQWKLRSHRVRVLHPGVDTNYFVPAQRDANVRRKLGWNDRPVLLTVGRLQKRKGQDTIIRALSTIREAVPNVLYAIAGDGEERSALMQLANSEGQQSHVQFMGKIGDAELRAAYQQANLFVLANRQVGTDIEGFGMVLLEAQACGTPVIAGASGGTAETMQLHETGHVVPCESPGPVAELIASQLLNESSLDEMGRKAREWAVSHFDWNCLAQQAAGLFGVASRFNPRPAAPDFQQPLRRCESLQRELQPSPRSGQAG